MNRSVGFIGLHGVDGVGDAFLEFCSYSKKDGATEDSLDREWVASFSLSYAGCLAT